MNEREAYDKLAGLMGAGPEIMPYLGELFLDQTIINPILPETVKKLGRILDLRPGQTLLDLACGKGGVSLPLVHIYKVKTHGRGPNARFHPRSLVPGRVLRPVRAVPLRTGRRG